MEVPRSEMAAAVVNELIYVPGGFDDDANNSAVSETYAPAANSWRRLTDMSQGRNHHIFEGLADAVALLFHTPVFCLLGEHPAPSGTSMALVSRRATLLSSP
jgi:hypothetical protein